MKKWLLVFVMFLCATAAAQEKDVTKFLGIPVDGFKPDMIEMLEAKGFVLVDDGTLEGEFNGKNVYLSIVTNNNKVYRIAVFDQNFVDETNIKINFNNLCSQFENNPRYISASKEDYKLSDSEDISYNMVVNKKRYEAAYFQKPIETTTKLVWFMIDSSYAKYRIVMFYDNPLNQANGEDL